MQHRGRQGQGQERMPARPQRPPPWTGPAGLIMIMIIIIISSIIMIIIVIIVIA